MNESLKPIDIIFDALQDLTVDIVAMQEHIKQLEAENQNLADQIIDLEYELKERTRGEYA